MALYTWLAAFDYAEYEHMYKRDRKKEILLFEKSTRSPGISTSLVLREWMGPVFFDRHAKRKDIQWQSFLLELQRDAATQQQCVSQRNILFTESHKA